MSAPILKLHIDERDNISVRVSQDVQVLTREEAERIEAEYKRMQAENESLRELCGFMLRCMKRNHHCDCCLVNGEHCEISYIESDARELGIEVDE